MFWRIPITDSEIDVNTPLGVRSLTHMFFEDKDGRIFRGGELYTVDVYVDGLQIADDLPVMAFCTSAPMSTALFKWEDIALGINRNVNLSEVKIKPRRWNEKDGIVNAFNVVFVGSELECDALQGVDYIEWRKIDLLSSATTADKEVVNMGSHNIKLLDAPQQVMAMALMTPALGGRDRVRMACYIPLWFNLTSGTEQIFPEKTDLAVIEVDSGVGANEAWWEFEPGTVNKNLTLTLGSVRPIEELKRKFSGSVYDGTAFCDDWLTNIDLYNRIEAWEVFFFFKYKKLL